MHISCFSFWHHDMCQLEIHRSAPKFRSLPWLRGYRFTTASAWSEVMHRYATPFTFLRQENRLNIHMTHKLFHWLHAETENGEFIWATESKPLPFLVGLFCCCLNVGLRFCVCEAYKQAWHGNKDVKKEEREEREEERNSKWKILKDVVQMLYNEE